MYLSCVFLDRTFSPVPLYQVHRSRHVFCDLPDHDSDLQCGGHHRPQSDVVISGTLQTLPLVQKPQQTDAA